MTIFDRNSVSEYGRNCSEGEPGSPPDDERNECPNNACKKKPQRTTRRSESGKLLFRVALFGLFFFALLLVLFVTLLLAIHDGPPKKTKPA